MNGSGKYALDSSVLLFDYFTRGTERTARLIANSILNHVTLSETLYVICRVDGSAKASDFIQNCASKSTLAPAERIAPLAGDMKCRFPISLADCWVLATAKSFDIESVFAFRESELLKNMPLLRREVQITFLDELEAA